MKEQYPEIHIPNIILDYLNNEQSVIEKTLIPAFPTKPVLPKEPESASNFSYIFFLAPLFLSFAVLIISKYNWTYTLIAYFSLLLFLIFNWYQDKKNYKRDIENYRIELSEFPSKEKEYASILNEIEKITEEVKILLNDSHKIFEFRTKYIKEKLLKPRTLFEYQNHIVGSTEREFENFLVKYFGSCIHKNKTLQIFTSTTYDYDHGFEFEEEKAYVPDFIFKHDKSHLHIDIEIDEPYIDDKPIHYHGNLHDTKRNEYFNKSGCLIIRFSEEQIKNNPNECCKEIAVHIHKLTGDNFYLNNLSGFDRIYKHKKWRKSDIPILIEKNYRTKVDSRIDDLI